MQKKKAIQVILYVCFVLLCISCKTTRPPKNPFPPPPPPPVVLDRDGDDIDDSLDKCPDVAGIAALQGCPDRDGDGIADADDKCPDVTGPAKYQGCPIPDTDGDGVNDELDNCPDARGNERSNGCPETDTAYAIGEEGSDSLAMEPGANEEITVGSAPPPPPPPPPHGEKSVEGADHTGSITMPADNTGNKVEYDNTIIAYSFRSILRVKEPQVFKVVVRMDKDNITVAKVVEGLKHSLHENHREIGGDTSIIDTIRYIGGKYYVVLLECDRTIFNVDSMKIPSEQELKNHGNVWVWKVTGLKEIKKEHITFNITVLDENKEPTALNPLTIPVSVTVVKPFPFKWVFIVLGGIVIALLVFLIMKKRVVPDTSIYFSYAWDDNKRTGIINRLDKSLTESKFITTRDADDLKPHERISEFMTRIGSANFVIIGLSDTYLRSRFCIYELYEIYRNSKMDALEFKSRIFPIRMDNLNLSDNINNYVLYWKAEAKKLLEEESVDYTKIKTIADDLPQLLGNLDDVLGFNLAKVEENDFAEIKLTLRKAIDKRKNN